jgi:asparagine synthase (glutamine-hydrolysing)
MAAPLLAAQGRSLTAYTSVPWLAPDGAGQRRLGNEWDLAHSTALMAGANVQHAPIDAADYGVIQGIEHVLDIHDGPSHAAGNHFWLQAVTESAVQNGAGGILTGQFGNATVSWAGNGSALRALLERHPGMALQLFLHAEPNPWLTLKRQLLKPLLLPGLRAFRGFRDQKKRPWQAYSALNPKLAAELDIDGRMRVAGHDSTFVTLPWKDIHSLLFRPVMCVGTGIWSEIGARHSVSFLDPTANFSFAEFILRVPDDQFRRRGQRSRLFQRTFRDRLPEPVLNSQRKGLQAADVGHRILKELPAFRECLDSLDSVPEAREVLDMRLLHSCLDDLVAKVDPGTTARADQILLRGLGVGLFLRCLA